MDFSRLASGAGPSLQIGAAGNGFRTCSLRRARHRNLMVASALPSAGGPFHLASRRAWPLRVSGRPLRCQGNDSVAYADGPLEGSKGSSEASEARRGHQSSGSRGRREGRRHQGRSTSMVSGRR
ncbi:hypothetical protein PR202_ga18544 [Eleusine coracana subsp. coracana]|uniref:Uncharacterized protein n=1 Tax=Eleusine coracana subsp. coracana TaxID=191504 RepID=A0AAV5CRN7_ELECO|nr:hypothetical protein PR202_ga18544 [Eleusine coracana subsp. coracana]